MSETPLARLAGHLVGQSIHDWIRERRPERKTWRAIAAELRETTNGQIDVPIQTLINWSPDPAPAQETDDQPSAAAS